MKRKMAIVAVAVAVAVAALAAAGTASAETFYWDSFTAEQAIEKSDWGDARGVANVSCAGKGRHVKEYGQFKFATFRCELEDGNYDRIGFVTVKTTGPEAWKPVGKVTPPRCPR